MNGNSVVPKVVTIREFRIATGLSKPTIYKMIRLKQIPGYKIGTRYVIPRPWFEAFLEGRWTPGEVEGPAEPPTFLHRKFA